MAQADKSGKDGNIQKTILAVKRSPYRMVRKNIKLTDSASGKMGSDSVLMSPSGEFILLPELLTRIIKVAAKEAVFELVDTYGKESSRVGTTLV